MLLGFAGDVLRPTRVTSRVDNFGILYAKPPSIVENVDVAEVCNHRLVIEVPGHLWKRYPRCRTMQRYHVIQYNFRIWYDVGCVDFSRNWRNKQIDKSVSISKLSVQEFKKTINFSMIVSKQMKLKIPTPNKQLIFPISVSSDVLGNTFVPSGVRNVGVADFKSSPVWQDPDAVAVIRVNLPVILKPDDFWSRNSECRAVNDQWPIGDDWQVRSGYGQFIDHRWNCFEDSKWI